MGRSVQESKNGWHYYSEHFFCIYGALHGERRTACWDGVEMVILVAGSQSPKSQTCYDSTYNTHSFPNEFECAS